MAKVKQYAGMKVKVDKEEGSYLHISKEDGTAFSHGQKTHKVFKHEVLDVPEDNFKGVTRQNTPAVPDKKKEETGSGAPAGVSETGNPLPAQTNTGTGNPPPAAEGSGNVGTDGEEAGGDGNPA